MDITHLTTQAYVQQRWKNGGGATTELARHVEHDRWLWRLSLAEVDRDGPFSDFAGLTRVIMLVTGRGMVLSFDAAPEVRIDRAYAPFAFDGAWKTECRLLDGPVKDLNLIFDPVRVAASIGVYRPRRSSPPRRHRLSGDCVLLYALRGRIDATVAGSRFALDAGDTLRLDDAHGTLVATAAPGADAAIAQIRIEHRGQRARAVR